MNKEGVIIFLSSEQDFYNEVTSASSFANPIPVIDLTGSTEFALVEIILPDEHILESSQKFELFRVQGRGQNSYVTVKVGCYRTTRELAGHLNSQIHDTVKMRNEIGAITHLFFSVSKNGCLIATPYKQNLYDSLNEQQWLGISDPTKAKEFAALTGFQETDIESFLTSILLDEFEATTSPTVISPPLLAVETKTLGHRTL